MSADKTLDLASIRARLDGTRGRRFWHSLEELADTEAFRDFVQARVPGARLRMARPGGPPRLPEADGRVDGARRRDRLHAPARRADRALRAAARRRRPRQAALLRDGDDARRRGQRACWPRATRDGRPSSKATRIIPSSVGATDAVRRRRSVLHAVRPGPQRSRSRISARSVPGRSFVAGDAESARRADRRWPAPASAS